MNLLLLLHGDEEGAALASRLHSSGFLVTLAASLEDEALQELAVGRRFTAADTRQATDVPHEEGKMGVGHDPASPGQARSGRYVGAGRRSVTKYRRFLYDMTAGNAVWPGTGLAVTDRREKREWRRVAFPCPDSSGIA